jgi:hypothetical protein
MESVLDDDIQLFIDKNLDFDIKKLALQKNPFPNIDWKVILNQIEAKSKARHKLPTWFNTNKILYPKKISIEQTSSEATAKYKANLVSGDNLIDLTGGFGVDAYYFSNHVKQVYHCEIDEELSKIVANNFEKLHVSNVSCLCGDSTSILKDLNQQFDCIYIDPSRRNGAKGKVFLLQDCSPDVPTNLEFYFRYASKILIKTAPILDISAGLRDLKSVKKIHIVAIENEVKELLWEIEKDNDQPIEIQTINFLKSGSQEFNFILNPDIKNILSSKIEKYLYEPNAAIMKSGGFNEICTSYKVSKLHQHSHLYTSDDLIEFPGRRFEVKKSFLYNKNEMTKNLKNLKINLTTRNFPLSVEQIRKIWNIEDGGNDYCFFTTDHINNKIVLICSKI